MLGFASLGSSYLYLRSRTAAEKRRKRATGDMSVSVDRSGKPWPSPKATSWYQCCVAFSQE